MLGFGRRRARRTVGLDVGSGLMKAAVLQHSREGAVLRRLASRPTPPGAMVEGEVVDPDALAASVEGLLGALELPSGPVVIGLDDRDVIVRTVVTERMPPETARAVIRWDAEEHIPFEMSDVHFDFAILDPDGGAETMRAVVVAARRDRVARRIGWLRERGIGPDLLDVGALALFNAIEYSHSEAADGVVGILSVGRSRTVVNILADGAPVLSSGLSLGTVTFRRRLRREHGLDPETAEEVTRGAGDVPGTRAAATAMADQLARRVEQGAAFLRSRQGSPGTEDARPGRFWVCGGGVRIPGFVDALARSLDAEVHVANPLGRLAVAPGALEGSGGDVPPALFVQAIGLGLREVR